MLCCVFSDSCVISYMDDVLAWFGFNQVYGGPKVQNKKSKRKTEENFRK